MTWLTPGAFAALALLAGPLVVHLLARRNARRLAFPATHFILATQAAAVRLRRPSDIGLLLLRLAIVAVAVGAAAHPLVMTPWRLAQWNARVSRAVIVDTGRSMPDPGVASGLGDGEARGAFVAQRLGTPDIADGIERAVRWLRATPPSRREIVLISDFQRGSLDEHVLRTIPPDVGIRLIRAGAQPDTRTATTPEVEGWRGGVWQATATIDATRSRATWTRRGNAATPGWVSVLASRADAEAADRALRAAASFGVPARDNGRRLIVRFTGADPLVPSAQPIQSAWIAAAATELRRSALLRDVEPVAVSERGGVMIVDAPVPAVDMAAPSIVRAALLAVRPADISDAEAEVAILPDADLARWRRDPAPVTGSGIPDADDSDLSAEALAEADSRWVWGLALLLLVAEGLLRRQRGRAAQAEVHANAA